MREWLRCEDGLLTDCVEILAHLLQLIDGWTTYYFRWDNSVGQNWTYHFQFASNFIETCNPPKET